MKRLLPVILILLGMCTNVYAQKGLAIQSAFDELAVRENATEVVMGAGRLKRYKLSLFHSLEIKNPTASERKRVETFLQADAEQAILHEEGAGHKLLELPRRKGLHRYVFYRQTSQSLILIYIEGKANLEQIKEKFLENKKIRR